MKLKPATTVATYCLLVLGGAACLLIPVSLPADTAPMPVTRGDSREIIVLKWSALSGRLSAGGLVGSGDELTGDFDVGQYVVANDRLVVRARSEVDNHPPLGSPDGNVANLCLDRSNRGLGVGSLVNTERPRSSQVSGGGESGSEVVSFICSGDRLLVSPKALPATSIVVQLGDFDPANADVSLILHGLDGRRSIFPPEVVETRLTPVAPGTYDIRFANLPGIREVSALERFDVRSGWYDPDRDRLTGGHFWLTAVTIEPEPVRPDHLVFSIDD
ncbi:MAG: hypothetical protein ACYTGG_03135 [Planctomycetota bacterium]|jgi:hypothetical protein